MNHYEQYLHCDESRLTMNLRKFETEQRCGQIDSFDALPKDIVLPYIMGGSSVKLTIRPLENGDCFLYFEFCLKGTITVELLTKDIRWAKNYEEKYQQPPYSTRYGLTKNSGFHNYYVFSESGSMLATKLYQYRLLRKEYETGESRVLELLSEEPSLSMADANCLKITLNPTPEETCFALLFSKSKLFSTEERLEEYADYYFGELSHNCVWCSFFLLPSGTYTKLPYSIEPFTKEGYGFSLHHSSKKDLFHLLMQTKERFYYDMLENAMFQAFLYQKREAGVFCTPYTSTWLKKEYGLTAPYVDTRLNETFVETLRDYLPYTQKYRNLDPLKCYADFILFKMKSNDGLFHAEEGVFLPDYFDLNGKIMCHASLNHQLGTACIVFDSYKKYRDERFLQAFISILMFLESTEKNWINTTSGNLYYGVKLNDGTFHFYGEDYIYVTIIDILLVQQRFQQHFGRKNQTLEYLTLKKMQYLRTTEYDPLSNTPAAAQGESTNSIKLLLKLLTQTYGTLTAVKEFLRSREEIVMSAKREDSVNQNKKTEESNIEIEKDNVTGIAMKKETVTLPTGINVTGYSGEYIFEKIKNNEVFYEEEILRKWYAPVADKTRIVYDIGANLGNHTLFFATHSPQAKLFSFEPFPPNYALLCENVNNNALREQVKTLNLALGECKDENKMSVEMSGNLGTASLSGNGEISVTVESLDNLNLPLPDFVKIDVEGYELHVLRGMHRLLEKATPIIWVETSTENVEELYAFLADYGYHLVDAELQLNNNLLFAVDENAVPGININLLTELVKKADQYRNMYWVKQELGSMTSKFIYEQHKAEDLKNQLGSMTSKYIYEQHKAEKLKQENNALAENCNVYRERSVYFKKLSEKHASQFLYEQKKAKALNEKMHRYEISKPYRVWAAYQKEKTKQKHRLYSFAQKTYYKSSRYPIVLKCFSGLNKILRVFPDTSEVIFYGAPKKANEAKTVHKESETYHNEPIEKVVPKSPRELNVAMIVDEFSYNSFRYECNAFPLEPSNWKQIFENNKIDLFFCESAWTGTDPDRRPWRGQIYASVNFPKENRTALLDILAYCKAHKIPTAFWNKEDPTHYEDRVHDFVKTALLFDHIFTSAGECVERYKRDYGHKSVHLLMFATQPRLFNPIERYDRSNAVIFAGSWYRQHPHRCEEMSAIFDNILNQGLELIIYNRQSENDDPNHIFPEKYQPFVRPRLRHDQLDAAYKGSKYALNINTVTDSPTMFARRVFELMSSNTLVLSNYSEGMQKLFGDKVVFVDGEKKIDLSDSRVKCTAALEEVLSQHTYQKRFEQILRDCGIRYCDEVNDLTVIYRVGSEEEAHNCLQLFQNITWREKNAILLVAKECDGEVLRSICVDYQSGNISVISEDYLERYGKALEIKTKYAVLADSTLSADFPARAMLHWCYLPENVGIGDGGSYTMRKRSDGWNVIFPRDIFSLTVSGATVYEI